MPEEKKAPTAKKAKEAKKASESKTKPAREKAQAKADAKSDARTQIKTPKPATTQPTQDEGTTRQTKTSTKKSTSTWVHVAKKAAPKEVIASEGWSAPFMDAPLFDTLKLGVFIADTTKRANDAKEAMMTAWDVTEDATGYAVLCPYPFDGSVTTSVRLTTGAARPYHAYQVGNIGTTGVATTQKVLDANTAERGTRGARGTSVMFCEVAAKHTSSAYWKCLQTDTEPSFRRLCRRSLPDNVRVENSHMWKVLKQKGTRKMSVRVPTKAVNDILSNSGVDGVFWKYPSFNQGREVYHVLPLKRSVDRRTAINAARKCGADVLGLALGEKRLSLRLADSARTEAVRALIGELAEVVTAPVPRYTVTGATRREHPEDIIYQLEAAGWQSVASVSTYCTGKERTCIVTADAPPTFDSVVRDDESVLWVRQYADQDKRYRQSHSLSSAKGKQRPEKSKLPPRADKDFAFDPAPVPVEKTSGKKRTAADANPTSNDRDNMASSEEEDVEMESQHKHFFALGEEPLASAIGWKCAVCAKPKRPGTRAWPCTSETCAQGICFTCRKSTLEGEVARQQQAAQQTEEQTEQ